MRVKSRKELDDVVGRKPEKKPDPPPVSPDLQQLAAAAEQMAAAAQMMAACASKPAAPKKMQADIHRDSQGRMEKVIITVI